jgi:hypothetical protein
MFSINKISNLIQAYRLHKNPSLIISDWQLQNIINATHNGHPTKGETVRNLVASAIKQHRKANPFKAQNFTKAKELYQEYFKMENHIPSYQHLVDEVNSGKTVYVTRFRTDVPVRGKRYNEYYINSSYCSAETSVYQLTQVSTSGEYINMNDTVGFANVTGISRGFFTNFRYATADEIAKFKEAQTQIAKLTAVIETKQKEIQSIWAQVNELKKLS